MTSLESWSSFLVVLLSIVVSVSQGRLSQSISYFLILAALGYIFSRSGSRNLRFSAFAGIGLLSGIVLYFFRKVSAGAFGSTDSLTVDSVADYANALLPALGYWLIDKGNVPNLAIVINLLEQDGLMGSHWYGLSFPVALTKLSSLTGDFPNIGQSVSTAWFHDDGGLPPTIIGEMFLNFGVVGVPIGLFLVGVFNAWFYSAARSSGHFLLYISQTISKSNNVSKKTNGKIALFQPRFLSISMTFIYRQLLGVADEFQPLVMATQIDNQEHFPYQRVSVKGKLFFEKLYSTAARRLFGRHMPMAPARREHWKRVLVENDIRLIHAHFGYAGLEVLDLARSLSLPLLVTFHGADASNMLKRRAYVRDLQDLFEYASVITVAETMARRLEDIGANREKMFVHYIGAPVEDFSFVKRTAVAEKVARGEPVTLLQVANFVEKKGHQYTLEAFAKLVRHYPECRLVLAGGGRLRSECEGLARRLGISGQVTFTGPVAKQAVIGLMGDADIFVHHSVTARNGSQEGLPTVLMEAMATGLPVVSTVHAGIPELVRDGENGYLVAERDIDAYTDKLLEALRAPEDMAEKASTTVREQFNLSVQTEKLKSIYAQVMDPPIKGAAQGS